MPAPPARMRSARVPCGLNSSASSFARYWRSNSRFSPTYDDTILRICRVASRSPSPNPSTPALLEITVRSRAPESRNARMRFSGMPQSPNPPDITVMPSRVSPASADLASANTFLLDLSGCIGLLGRMRVLEGREGCAVLRDQREPRVSGDFNPEARGGEQLRHEAAIRHRRRISVRKLAGKMIALQMRVVRIQPANDPFAQPRGDAGLVDVELVLEIHRGAGVLQRLDVAGDDLRQHAHACTIHGIARDQAMVGESLIEIFDDGQRLHESLAVVNQRGHAALRIHGAVGRAELLAAVFREIDRMQDIRQCLEIERNAYPIGRRA